MVPNKKKSKCKIKEINEVEPNSNDLWIRSVSSIYFLFYSFLNVQRGDDKKSSTFYNQFKFNFPKSASNENIKRSNRNPMVGGFPYPRSKFYSCICSCINKKKKKQRYIDEFILSTNTINQQIEIKVFVMAE